LSRGHAPLQVDKLTLFKKSQKLLDRFLFIFFAEDRGLIPPNAELLNNGNNCKNLTNTNRFTAVSKNCLRILIKGTPTKSGAKFLHTTVDFSDTMKF